MHDGIDPGERRSDTLEVRDIGLVAGDTGHRPPVESPELPGTAQVLEDSAADAPAQPGDEDGTAAQPGSSRFSPKSSGTVGPHL